ncbi:hypothetical protein K501DRAFT_261436 [Backusella circina FSU 941]|nr:hypothetical protein K501DRAFT_261436 [Backusella circina FSU 941]
MSDTENTAGSSPIDRSKRPRFETEEWDSDYEQDNHDDRHPKRQAVPDPETKAPHFVPIDEKSKKKSDCAHKEEEQEKLDEDEDGEPQISIRSLVGTKDAGVIIGRAGKNVSEIRELSAARVTISEIVQGAYERILTVTGPVQAVAKAYSLVGEKILSENTQGTDETKSDSLSIKLLVPDNRMGTLIGKSGTVIKSIQDSSGARLNASEEPLPMSTERTVTIQGTPVAIQQAVYRIADILLEHSHHHQQVIMYRPLPQMHMNNQRYMRNNSNNRQQQQQPSGNNGASNNVAMAAMMGGYNGMMPMPMASQFYYQNNPAMAAAAAAISGYGGMPTSRQADYSMAASQAQQIFIPNEMVGCIIGKGGSKINEIRQLSGSHIKIADPHGNTNERLVTITGTPESNQMALYLLYSRLESEKNRLGMH